MQLILDDEHLEVRLSLWQKVLGLLRNIRVQREHISGAHVVSEPLRDAMSAGTKVGLRVPWFYYVARTLRLDQAFIVRRGVPALAFDIHDGRPLTRVLVSTPDADALAGALSAPATRSRGGARAAGADALC